MHEFGPPRGLQRSRKAADEAPLCAARSPRRRRPSPADPLKDLFLATEPFEGEAFLDAAVTSLSRFLGADCIFIGKLTLAPEGPAIRSLALANAGKLAPNITYPLAHSPCSGVIGRKACVYPLNVAEMFPLDIGLARRGVQGYVGVPLQSHKNEPLGLMVGLFKDPIEDPDLVRSLFTLYSGRVASFLEMCEASDRATDAEQRLKTLAENAPLGIVFCDAGGKVTAWRGSCHRIFGYHEDEAIGRPATDFALEGDRGILSSALHAVSSDQGYSQVTTASLGKDGRILFGEWHNTAYRDASGNMLGISSFVTDVTDAVKHRYELEQNNRTLAQLAQRLSQEAAKAEKASEAKTQFLATASHELRTPLNAVIGFAEMLRHEIYGPLGDRRYFENIGHILDSANSLLRLIDQVLDASRLVSEEFEVNVAEVPASAVVREVALEFQPLICKRRQSLRLDLPSQEAGVATDPLRLKQCVRHLIDNASKYAGSGGKIAVQARLKKDRLAVQVSDTGPGIPEDHIEKVLQPFHRVADARQASEGGLGLGLFIVNQLLGTMGGSLELRNRDGGGLTATIVIPASAG